MNKSRYFILLAGPLILCFQNCEKTPSVSEEPLRLEQNVASNTDPLTETMTPTPTPTPTPKPSPTATATPTPTPMSTPTTSSTLKPLLTTVANQIFSDHFSSSNLASEWNPNGIWNLAQSFVTATNSGGHQSSLLRSFNATNLAFLYSFRFSGADEVGMSFRTHASGDHLHLLAARATPSGFELEVPARTTRDQVAFKFQQGTWYTALVEVADGETLIQLSNGCVLYAPKTASLDIPKTQLALAVSNGSGSFDNVQMWQASASSSWPAKKAAVLNQECH